MGFIGSLYNRIEQREVGMCKNCGEKESAHCRYCDCCDPDDQEHPSWCDSVNPVP